MPPTDDRSPVPGSERGLPAGAREAGPVDPEERIEVSVVLRPRGQAAALGPETLGAVLPRERPEPHRRAVETAFSAAPDDIRAVEAFARAHGLEVVHVSAPRRTVILAGTAAALSAAFGTDLSYYEHGGRIFRGRTGALSVPAELADIVVGIFGLDDRPQAHPHFRLLGPEPGAIVALAASAVYTPRQLAHLYNFPTGLDGKGQCIGIIELGGGYKTADLNAYWQQLQMAAPKVVAVSVDGGQNAPEGNPDGADGEVMLDIEVAGAVAPGAQIVVYFAPNTDRGFLDAITTAVHDTQHKPSIVSISWGGAEPAWTAQALQAFDTAFQEAAALGITICCASGDDGSSDRVGDGAAHVDFPASSPHVLACGGTRLESSDGSISREEVWNEGASGGATGGGVSAVFPLPAWQQRANVPPSANDGDPAGRGVPDVAGDADPVTGYSVRVDGQTFVIGGTSAVAPLWAGLLALINQHLGKPVGYLNPLLYTRASVAATFHDITEGNNGAYQAGTGWDACTGLGTPDGARLLTALSG